MSKISLKNAFYNNPHFWFYLSDLDFVLYARLNIVRYNTAFYLPPEYNEQVINNMINDFEKDNYLKDVGLNAWVNNIINIQKNIKNISYKDLNIDYIKSALWTDLYFFLVRLHLGKYKYSYFDYRIKGQEVDIFTVLNNVFNYNVSSDKMSVELAKMNYFMFLSQRTNIKQLIYEFSDRIQDKNISYSTTRDFIILFIHQIFHYADLYNSKNFDNILQEGDLLLSKIKKRALIDSLEIIKVLLNVIHTIALSDSDSLSDLRNKMDHVLDKKNVTGIRNSISSDTRYNIFQSLDQKHEVLYCLFDSIYNKENLRNYEDNLEKTMHELLIKYDLEIVDLSDKNFKQLLTFYNSSYKMIYYNKYRVSLIRISLDNNDMRNHLYEWNIIYNKLTIEQKKEYFIILTKLKKNEKKELELKDKYLLAGQKIEKDLLILTTYILSKLCKIESFDPKSYTQEDEIRYTVSSDNIWKDLEEKYCYGKYYISDKKQHNKNMKNYTKMSEMDRQGAPATRQPHLSHIQDQSINEIRRDPIYLVSLSKAINFLDKKHNRIIKSSKNIPLAKIKIKEMPKNFFWLLKFEIFNSSLLLDDLLNDPDYSNIEKLGYLLSNKIHNFLEDNSIFYSGHIKLTAKLHQFCFHHIYKQLEICRKEYSFEIKEYKNRKILEDKMNAAKCKQEYLKDKTAFLDRHQSNKQVQLLEIYNVISLNKYHEAIFDFKEFKQSFDIDLETRHLMNLYKYSVETQFYTNKFNLHPLFTFSRKIADYMKSCFTINIVKNNSLVYKSIELLFHSIKRTYKTIPVTEKQANQTLEHIKNSTNFHIRADKIAQRFSNINFSYKFLDTNQLEELQKNLVSAKQSIEDLFALRGTDEIILSEPYIIPCKMIFLLAQGFTFYEQIDKFNFENQRYDFISKFFLSCLTEQIVLYNSLVSETFQQSIKDIDDWSDKLNHYKKFPALVDLFRTNLDDYNNNSISANSNIPKIDPNYVVPEIKQINHTIINNVTLDNSFSENKLDSNNQDKKDNAFIIDNKKPFHKIIRDILGNNNNHKQHNISKIDDHVDLNNTLQENNNLMIDNNKPSNNQVINNNNSTDIDNKQYNAPIISNTVDQDDKIIKTRISDNNNKKS